VLGYSAIRSDFQLYYGILASQGYQVLRLPLEIILLVASMLPTPSAACLALCSRRLSHILGPGFWRSLQSEAPSVLLAFLSSLAKDLPQHFVCQECACLHRMSAITWPRIITRGLGPRCTWQSLGYRHYSCRGTGYIFLTFSWQ